MRPTLWLTSAALVLAACGGGGDSTGPSTRSLAGGWQGSTGGVTIALTLVAQGYQPRSLTGTRAGGQISGTLNGSGFNSVPITLYKN